MKPENTNSYYQSTLCIQFCAGQKGGNFSKNLCFLTLAIGKAQGVNTDFIWVRSSTRTHSPTTFRTLDWEEENKILQTCPFPWLENPQPDPQNTQPP